MDTTVSTPKLPLDLLREIRGELAPYGWDVMDDGGFCPRLGYRSPLFIRYSWGKWQVINPLRRKKVLISTPFAHQVPKLLMRLYLKSTVFMGV